MAFLTRNVFDFYNKDVGNAWYLNKFFLKNDIYGTFVANAKNVISKGWNGTEPFAGTFDEVNDYNINKFGCRGEIDEHSDVIASGCSITFGLGVPELGRWTNLLGNKINKNIINLGGPGASVESVCLSIIQYSLNNKMPKEVYCLFPDFFRRKSVVDKEFFKTKTDKEKVYLDTLNVQYVSPTIRLHEDTLFMGVNDIKYIEDSVSPHQRILDSVNNIYVLEAFCLTNNIKLYWTTWDLPSHKIMESLNSFPDFKLKNFKPFFPEDCKKGFNGFVNTTCLLGHKSDFKDHACWTMGTDYSVENGEISNKLSHPGIHCHTHTAEFFYNLRNENIPDA